MAKKVLRIALGAAVALAAGAGCASTGRVDSLEERVGNVEAVARHNFDNSSWTARAEYQTIVGANAPAGLTPEELVDGIETSIKIQTDITKGVQDYNRMVGKQGFDSKAVAKGVIQTNLFNKINGTSNKARMQQVVGDFAKATFAQVKATEDGSKVYVAGGRMGVDLTIDQVGGIFRVQEGYHGPLKEALNVTPTELIPQQLTPGNFRRQVAKTSLNEKVAGAQGVQKVAYVVQQVQSGHYATPTEGTAAIDSAVRNYLETPDGKNAELNIMLGIPRCGRGKTYSLNMGAVYATGAISPEQAARALVGRVDASEDTVRVLLEKGLVVQGNVDVQGALDREDCQVTVYRNAK